MTPAPQEPKVSQNHTKEPELMSNGDRIVISGMSGLFPQSLNIQDFSDLLYNKVVTQTTPRYTLTHPELPESGGSVPGLEHFDAQFFKVLYRLAKVMEPSGRKLLEQAYQAIYDAGNNPLELSGQRIGVYVGSALTESEKFFFYDGIEKVADKVCIMGSSKTMFANRISYWLNAKGPSMAIDMACCSATAALEQAYLAMKRGDCESAVVAGCSLCMHPHSVIHSSRVIKLSKNGKTRSFDANADGCGRSEAINVLFLQKAKDAKRIYGELLHAKAEYSSMMKDENGFKYGFDRDVHSTADFIKRFYEEADIDPQRVGYVEAFGCGNPSSDKNELDTLEKAYCGDTEDTLLVGSVMSNFGYSEAATGITSIMKVLLGFHTGKLAANLHCDVPRQEVRALREGRMRVVTEHQPFSRELAAVNGLSITGVNSHVLLHSNYKPKDLSKYESSIPRIVAVSGRHEEAVQYMFDQLKTHPIDPEQLGLLHNIHRSNIPGHVARGYTVLDTDETNKTVSVGERVEYSDTKRPLWFVYSGMGSQWCGMGTQLMRIPIFAAAIQRCHNVLEPKGLNILEIITSPDKKIFDNVLQSFVGIAAIQIGLTDVLRAVGLEPEGIIGHSLGEMGCAYADGCLSAEEMILATYCRGLASLNTKFIKGAMAAVGLGYKQISKLCPPEIDVACRNSAGSSTISGPAEVVKNFVAQLTAQGVFAKEVNASNIAYHSRYIKEAGPKLLSYLKEVIKSPKPRSKRWVSTSVPESEWGEPAALFCSAEYATNNLLNPVYFEEADKYIPPNAVLVEIAPHGLLQAILKRSMPSDVRNIPLTRRDHRDNVVFLLEALGSLFIEGFNPKLDLLYPKIEFPVSTGTPFLSHLVKWAHGEKWDIAVYNNVERKSGSTCTYNVSTFDEEHAYFKGNVVRGKVLYPFAASIILAWDTLAMVLGAPKRSISVKLTELRLHSQPILHDRRSVKLNITLQRGTGAFEILNNDSKVLSGYIQQIKEAGQLKPNLEVGTNNQELRSTDIYNLLRDKDFLYSGDFQSLDSTNPEFSSGLVTWSDNWVTFIDGLLQLNTLRQNHHGVSVPSLVREMSIDVKQHLLWSENDKIPAVVSEQHDNTRCGGVIIENLVFEHLLPRIDTKVAFKELKDTFSVKHDVPKEVNYKLSCAQIGHFESLEWIEAPTVTDKGIPVTVHYVGINMDDMKAASGSLLYRKDVKHFGVDFSGVTDSGSRIMGLCTSGAACHRLVASPALCWPVPRHWSLQDAATVPLAYTLAYYCMAIKFKLFPHNTVYVHGGCGALGQAVIGIALSIGCRVLTAVSDTGKKRFLRRLFPKLKDENIGFSRNPNFSDFVLRATNGAGCDLVICTAVGEEKHNASKACAQEGLVVDLSQLQERSIFSYGMNHMTKSRSYMMVNLQSILENEEAVRDIQALISHGISHGFVRPLTRVTYDVDKVPSAFRLLAASQHRGRVLLQFGETVPQITPRMFCSSSSSHVILCNDNILGLQVADRLVARGANKLYVHYKNASSPYFLAKKRSWKSQGVHVTVLEDIPDSQTASDLLKQVTLSGHLEGLYFIARDQDDEKFVKTLDIESRKLNLNPKYFAILCVGTRVAEDVCQQRILSGFNAVNLLMTQTDTLCTETLDIVESALTVGPNILTCTKRDKTNLVEQIFKLADISSSEAVDEELTLSELGLSRSRIPAISSFLRNTYNIAYDDEKISSLTIKSLLQLDRDLMALPFEATEGWYKFFRYVDSDELLATTDLIFMPTLSNPETMRSDEFYQDQTFLCIVPGMEGHYARFQGLCERLKVPALVLQPDISFAHEPVEDTARKLTQVLLQKADLKNNFILLGYETGVIVALEMAAILEQQGMTGTVFCLGHSPTELKQVHDEFTSKFASEEELQDSLIRHMCSLISERKAQEFVVEGGTWDAKLESAVRGLIGISSRSSQYICALMTAALYRVCQLKNYCFVKPARALRSKIVLMRAATAHAPHPTDLQLYSLQKISVHQLTASLADVLLDLKCASIINSHLDPNLLEKFATKNNCDTYLVNGGQFIRLA